MTSSQQYGLSEIDLSGSQYTVEQTGRDKNFRPEYEARDVAGDTLFRTTYQMYEERDEFPFVDADGTEICRVKAIDTWDIAGDYLLTDSQTEKDLVIFDNDLSLLQDTWRIRDAEDESLLAEVNSRGALVTLARKLLPVGQGIAHKYEITDSEGGSVGSIEGEFALFDFDQYEITLTDTSSVPTEPIVIAAIVIDAIQGN
ncbi:LURP-one-related/scramblase family protein [Halobellus limi]|uniref:Uncharacterized protein n=1 Tax=Halobellus limi TaxID=699433 RepID=A0A1H6BSI2_9EURY|nr:hypothetical protein [Halobellus limi]QCC49337.1 hypothetical protein DV707_16390 [Halobellus limi]SEG63659.1 hypothetical protein SAMN04488133_2989 [Halobellus limi]